MLDSISIPGPLMEGKNENALRMVSWNDAGGLNCDCITPVWAHSSSQPGWDAGERAGSASSLSSTHLLIHPAKTWRVLKKEKETVGATVPGKFYMP